MKLRTKIDVTYNDGITGTATGIVEGILISAGWTNQDFTQVGANYAYLNASGETIIQAGFTVDGSEIQTLYNAIKDSIPTGLDYRETEMYKYYLAFMYQMSQTFGIQVTDIEIV